LPSDHNDAFVTAVLHAWLQYHEVNMPLQKGLPVMNSGEENTLEDFHCYPEPIAS